jgi:hypothetical protein
MCFANGGISSVAVEVALGTQTVHTVGGHDKYANSLFTKTYSLHINVITLQIINFMVSAQTTGMTNARVTTVTIIEKSLW